MPLLDRFHPPLSRRRHWDSFHGAWAEAITTHLNQELLPERYYAEARVTVGNRVEIDVATLDEQENTGGGATGVALWAPPKPQARIPLNFANVEGFEVQVINDTEGPNVVAAVELVSPANKERPLHRKLFIAKCASYLQQRISVIIVDVVTGRSGNLHAELLDFLDLSPKVPGLGTKELYAAAHRTVATGADTLELEIWAELLAIGAELPTVPLWLQPDQSVPLDLEQTYRAACANRRIDL